jgi:hypothetical protein
MPLLGASFMSVRLFVVLRALVPVVAHAQTTLPPLKR